MATYSNAVKKVYQIYFSKLGTILETFGDTHFNAQDDEVAVIKAFIEDGVVDNVTTLVNFTPEGRTAFTSHWFPMFYRGLQEKIVSGEAEPRTFAQFEITLPSIVLLMNGGKTSVSQSMTVIQRYGSIHLGNFATITDLNTDNPASETYFDDSVVAFVYSNEAGQTDQVGFYQVEEVEEVWTWVLKTTLLYALSTKQYNGATFTVGRGPSNPQGVPTVSQSLIYQLMQEISYLDIGYQSLDVDMTDLQDKVEALRDGSLPIEFDKTGTDLDAGFIEEAIKEVNVKTNANKQNIEKIVDGTTIVKRAEQDASGNVITATYETKADATSKLATKVDKTRKIIGIDLQDDILLTEFKTAIGNATQSVAGLLSAEDKTHLDGLVALLESSDGNNIVDTIGEILEIFQNYPEGADLVTVLQGKVDKIEGKELSTNDFTDLLKAKLDSLLDGTQYYDKIYIDALKEDIIQDKLDYAEQSLNIKNEIINGDFSNGIVGWEPYAGTLSVVDNKLNIIGNGTGQHIRGQQQTVISSQVGNKIYVKSSITLNDTADEVVCQVSGNAGTPVTVFQLFNVESGTYEFSGIVELPVNFVGNLRVQFWHYYADSATANGKVMSVGQTTMIDLTKVFGVGNEFGKEDMDTLMTFTNGWFDGKLKTNQILNWLKSISQTEIDHKVDIEVGKGLSSNDYTNEDKLKVNEIPQIQEDMNSLTIGEFGVGFVTNNMLSNEVKESINIKRPQNVITLIGGQDDEVPKPALSLNTVTTDLVNFKIGDRGWKVNIVGNTGHLVDFEPESGAWSFPPICAIGAWIYIEDSTKLTNLRINFYNDSAKTIISSYPAEIYGFKTGWNLFRWSVDYPNTKLEFSSIYRIRLTGGTTDATSYTIGHIWAECSEKAQILFIHDGGYKDFYLNGYPDLKARNIPVTWGLIPNRIDTGDVAFLTPVQADILSKENNNSMSFHSWNLDVLNNFNASQLRAETMKSLKWLKSKGYTGGIFRSAFTQNLAPEHAAIQNLVLAYRRVSNGTTNTLTCYPFPNRYDIDMIRLHQFNSNLQGLTDMFASMKKFRTLMVGYTHMVNVAGATDMTPELWNHFLNLIDNGIAEGWLEGVTFETLIARSGVKFKRGLGDTVIEIYDEVGELKKIRLP